MCNCHTGDATIVIIISALRLKRNRLSSLLAKVQFVETITGHEHEFLIHQ